MSHKWYSLNHTNLSYGKTPRSAPVSPRPWHSYNICFRVCCGLEPTRHGHTPITATAWTPIRKPADDGVIFSPILESWPPANIGGGIWSKMSKRVATKAKKDLNGEYTTYMVTDTREREILPFLDDAFQENEYTVKQINTGDYVILRRSRKTGIVKFLAVIERKTHEDFAAGFRDGRYENLSKLLALRAKTGCQIYFIIEGSAFPSPNRKFGRVPFSSIDAAITKSMVRHGIMIIYAENQQHTAKRLADLVSAMASEEKPYEYPLLVEEDTPAEDDAEPAESENLLTVPESMTARIEDSDQDATTKMWARLRGISVVLGRILTDHFSVIELVGGKVPRAQIDGLKTATGRPINKDARNNLHALATGDAEAAIKVLSGVRGISPAMATLMVKQAGDIRRLLSYSVSTLSIIGIPQKNRIAKLGDARAERILKIMAHKRGTEPALLPSARQAVTDDDEQQVTLPNYTLDDEDIDDILGE
jgi:ERCC4-type nuclease